ncbi:MAG: threonine synthase [Planctomycetes bacterium]|nr:threonine synthase [Planctomycetota bacterium]
MSPAPFHLECIACARRHGADPPGFACEACGSLLTVVYEPGAFRESARPKGWSGQATGVWRYRGALPVATEAAAVTLAEGNTRLHRCPRLGEKLGLDGLHVKTEGDNPTGSFKDRGMTVGVTKAVERGARTVLCASTGNTSASLAAYAARAGLRAVVLIPAGQIAFGKLAQAVVHGARVVQLRGNFDEGLALAIRLAAERKDLYLLNSINPYRLEGQKTLAYELYEQLGQRAPDVVIAPVGNAGNLSAIWKGFQELAALGLIGRLPRLVGVQAECAAPVVAAWKAGRDRPEPWPRPETLATAIRIGAPVCGVKVLRALRDSGGSALAVSDAEIVEAQRRLARTEGLFIEPGSAAAIAGLSRLAAEAALPRDATIVCVATGAGLKDPDTAIKHGDPPVEADATMQALERLLIDDF